MIGIAVNGDFMASYKRANDILDMHELSYPFAPNDGSEDVEKSMLDGRFESVLTEGSDTHKRRAFGIRENERLSIPDLLKRQRGDESALAGASGASRPSFPSTTYIAASSEYRRLDEATKDALKQFFRKHGNDTRFNKVFQYILPDGPEWRKIDALIFYEDELNSNLKAQGLVKGTHDECIEKLHSCLSALREVHPSPYLAFVAADGDGLSKHRGSLESVDDHVSFSAKLSGFAKKIRQVVEKNHGFPVFSGGDDLSFFAPVADVLDIIEEVRGTFREEFPTYTMSFGVAIRHRKTPMRGEMYRVAEEALQTSKNAGRNRVTFDCFKRSGTPLRVTLAWPEPSRSSHGMDGAEKPNDSGDGTTTPETDAAALTPGKRLSDWVEAYQQEQIPSNLPYALRILTDKVASPLEAWGASRNEKVNAVKNELRALFKQKDKIHEDHREKFVSMVLRECPVDSESQERFIRAWLEGVVRILLIARFLANKEFADE